jgi:hypothetical protein
LAPGVSLRGYGHYHETYEKIDGQWRITSSKLTRLREDIFNVFVSVYISDRIKKAVGRAARVGWCGEHHDGCMASLRERLLSTVAGQLGRRD